MFRSLQNNQAPLVTVFIEGLAVKVPENATVASAVMAYRNGPTRFTAISQSPRAPYCMMGVCFECLMIVDGKSNCQACMQPVHEGMTIEVQQGTGLSVV